MSSIFSPPQSLPQSSLDFLAAVAGGDIDRVKSLLPFIEDNDNECKRRAVRVATTNDDIEMIKLLLPLDPKANYSEALLHAADYGRLEIVKLLLPFSDPLAGASMPLICAAEKGHLEVVQLLLPLSDPKANGSEALLYAADNSHFEIVRLLFPVSDGDAVLRAAKNQAWSSEGFSYLKQLVKAKEDKDFLERNLLSGKECQTKKAGPKKL